ncbi:hypothetical protein [Streptomyces sp. NBC_00366]|uniref:hypothetical protein n=1 Tax=Streptomyces sp. NBC_00366 TaxID=2975727 RepID=UPI002E26BA87
MRTPWYRQLFAFLRTREGLGTLLIAVFSAIALGVVPNMLQKLWDSAWFYLGVFLIAVLIVILGWVLRRPHGVGVVVPLFPTDLTQTSLVAEMRRASAKNHSSTLFINPRLLRPGGKALSPADRVDLVAGLIDARADEFRSSGAEGAVTLYVLAAARDAFLLGRRLYNDRHAALTVMHLSRQAGEPVVPGVTLTGRLTHPLSARQQTLLGTVLQLPVGTSHAEPVAHPSCPPQHRHRLAFIVRLTAVTGMVDDAICVAQTGKVRRPHDQTHTGYIFDDTHPDFDGSPCGAHVVIEASVALLPETKDVFEAVAADLRHAWAAAKAAWQAETGSTNIETRVFMTAPLPITLALGWLTAHENISIVNHDIRLLNAPAPTP